MIKGMCELTILCASGEGGTSVEPKVIDIALLEEERSGETGTPLERDRLAAWPGR